MFDKVYTAFALIASAQRAAAAAEAGAKPRTRDLERLGIDVRAFNKIGRF